MTIKIELSNASFEAVRYAYYSSNGKRWNMKVAFNNAISAALEAMVEEGTAVEGYADNLGLVRVLTIRLGEEAMTSRADSLTHDDLQKAEIERLRAALAEVHLTINTLYTERDKARAALAEAREVIRPLSSLLPGGREGLDDDHQVLISQLTMGDLRRAAQWLERNP